MLAAFASIGTLAAFHDRPTMDEMIIWIDHETLLLIFSMMIIVAILIDTGIFDYIAVYTFQVRATQNDFKAADHETQTPLSILISAQPWSYLALD